MWRRIYLILLLVRLYFALAPSYLHPDENFQGPEVIAGRVFPYSIHLTWEFTSARPIRSVFPLWPVYGLPMLLLRWVWAGNGSNGEVSPQVVYWALRLLMFTLSFVLEDWAIHELVPSPRHRRVAVLLTASSYVTWTLQTHTFSNSVETLVVAWSLVLIQRIVENKRRSSVFTSGILGLLLVFGTFNRITFPAFVAIPGLRLLPHFKRRPSSLLSILVSGTLFIILAILFDTRFYIDGPITYSTLLSTPVVTPLNNLFYNLETNNLARHGLHPYYQHVVANLPQLLGPAFLLLLTRPNFSLPLISAISGIAALSPFQHQEARFLIPTVPLILSSVRLPQRLTRFWLAAWVGFNVVMGILMGVYHQGGVIPTQFYLASKEDATQAFWWRTYSPPIWLLNGKTDRLQTTDLMGLQPDVMMARLSDAATCLDPKNGTRVGTYLVAPRSSTFLDQYTGGKPEADLTFEEVWTYKNHINLDDLDLAVDGVWPTLKRVVGRRGLTTWRVSKSCS